MAEAMAPAVRVLFAHATGLCKEVWRPVIDALGASGGGAAPLISHWFDFRAHGSRGGEPLTEAACAWDGFAVDDVVAAVAAVRAAGGTGPIVGVGHSFGGAALVKVP